MTDLTKLTAEELLEIHGVQHVNDNLIYGRPVVAEIRRRLERLEKCEARRIARTALEGR